jgi:Flp pilus assembly protein TadD
MTIRFMPTISEAMIESMDVFDAFRTGEQLVADRHPRDAVRVLRKVVDAEPGNGAAWELLGRAHFAAAQLVPAEQAFRRLVEIEPTSAWAQTALGLSLDRQSRHQEGAMHHRLAAAMGASPHDATRVELVDRQVG